MSPTSPREHRLTRRVQAAEARVAELEAELLERTRSVGALAGKLSEIDDAIPDAIPHVDGVRWVGTLARVQALVARVGAVAPVHRTASQFAGMPRSELIALVGAMQRGGKAGA